MPIDLAVVGGTEGLGRLLRVNGNYEVGGTVFAAQVSGTIVAGPIESGKSSSRSTLRGRGWLRGKSDLCRMGWLWCRQTHLRNHRVSWVPGLALLGASGED